MASKFRYLLLLTLFVGLTCGAAGVSAQTGGGKAPVEGGGTTESPADVSALAGKWVSGQLGGTVWTYTGSYANPNGSRFTYQFSPDGTVWYTSVNSFSTGTCTHMTVLSKKGRASLSGDTLTIKWGRAFSKEDVFCDRVTTNTKTLRGETETFKVVLKNSSSGQRQLCTVSKFGETCFSPAE